MTKDQVRDALVAVAEEFEAVGAEAQDLQSIARVYRRAASLVDQIEEHRGPGRPRGSVNRVTTTSRRRTAGTTRESRS